VAGGGRQEAGGSKERKVVFIFHFPFSISHFSFVIGAEKSLKTGKLVSGRGQAKCRAATRSAPPLKIHNKYRSVDQASWFTVVEMK